MDERVGLTFMYDARESLDSQKAQMMSARSSPLKINATSFAGNQNELNILKFAYAKMGGGMEGSKCSGDT